MNLRTRTGHSLAGLVACMAFAGCQSPSHLSTSARAGTDQARLERLERELEALRGHHRQELDDRDHQIAGLKAQQPGAPGATTAPAGGEHGEQGRVSHDLQKHAESHKHAGDTQGAHPETQHESARFAPDITVIGDLLGSVSPDRENDAYNRFDLREAELDLRAPIDPRADGVLILGIERDLENPIFPVPGEDGEGGPETSITFEEAYLFLHDLGVPDLTAKLGRFHLRFGRQNLLHLHELPTFDAPFVNQAFLAPEALVDAGVSLNYRLPPRYVAGQHIELTGELVSGEGAGSESPVLAGDLSVDSPAFNVHALWNGDLTQRLNLEIGGSWLRGHRDGDNALDADVFGLDLTLLHKDPTGGPRDTLFQAEAIYGLVDTAGAGQQSPFGAYLLGQQQLNRDWNAGLRLDWTQNPDADDQEAWGLTPYVTWYWSEFVRFRVAYQRRDGDRAAEDVLFFQTTFTFGAQPHRHDQASD